MLTLIGAVFCIWVAVAALVLFFHVLIVVLNEDRSSSRSRQHYIDTGRYLTKRQVREEERYDRGW